ncbi:hypothetical protein EHM69_04345 [candidate division KSB1 bacterium]|nr:MAG: hypothetical protein EHM69_04345 [candidate division KSB1 bacterium]
MRDRVSLFFNDLSLEEILHLEEELDRCKEKYRRNYAVLSVQTDRPIMRTEHLLDLERFHRDMRRFISGSAATGGGSLLYFSPELSVVLFQSVAGASRACSALLSGLPELNGQYRQDTMRVGLKLGLASGTDTLAPGSPRSLRSSQLVRRANQAAWRGTPNNVIMDENSYHEWPEKLAVEPVPFDIEGQHSYRAIPGMLGKHHAHYDDEALMRFLRQVADAGIPTLKYDLERIDEVSDEGKQNAPSSVQIAFEAYDAEAQRNLQLKEKIAIADYGDRIEVVKRMMSTLGLALVRYETAEI